MTKPHSADTSLAPAVSFTHWSPSDHFPVCTKLSINPTPLPPPTLHSLRRFHSIDIGSFLTDLKSSQLIIDPPKSLGPLLITYSIPSTWQTYSDRHQTLQASFSIKSMVYSNPTRLSIQPPPCMPKTLETHTLSCWLVLLQVSPQPIPEAHPVFEKVNYCSLVTSASDNPQGSRRLNLQVHNNFSVNYIGWKFQREFSSGYVFSRIVALSARRRHTLLRSCTWLPTYSVGSHRRLRGASTSTLVIPSTRRTTLGDRAFPVTAARAWNALPSSVRSAPSLLQCREPACTRVFLP